MCAGETRLVSHDMAAATFAMPVANLGGPTQVILGARGHLDCRSRGRWRSQARPTQSAIVHISCQRCWRPADLNGGGSTCYAMWRAAFRQYHFRVGYAPLVSAPDHQRRADIMGGACLRSDGGPHRTSHFAPLLLAPGDAVP